MKTSVGCGCYRTNQFELQHNVISLVKLQGAVATTPYGVDNVQR